MTSAALDQRRTVPPARTADANWFVWVWGPDAEALVERAARHRQDATRGAPTVVRGGDFGLAYAPGSRASLRNESACAAAGDLVALIVGRVDDWGPLEGATATATPREPDEPRPRWLRRLHTAQPRGDWLDHLSGTFATLIYDRREGALYVGRDPLRGQAVFWHRGPGGRLILSSHLETLLALPDISPRLNEHELFRYLFLNAASDGPATPVASINLVRADERMRFDPSGERCVSRWRPTVAEVRGSDEEVVRELRRRLEMAIGTATRAARHPAVALSGGVDSSALAALLARQHHATTITTHSVVYPEFAAERARVETFLRTAPVEGRLITPTPEEFAADFETLVRVTELPFHHPGYYSPFRAYESAAAAGAEVLLSGIGAGTVLGELVRHVPFLIRDLNRTEGVGRALGEARHLVQGRGWPFLLGYPLLSIVPGPVRTRLWERYSGATMPSAWKTRFGPVPRHQRWGGDLATSVAAEISPTLAPEILGYDRMGTHFGVEIRYPFLDHGVMEWLLGLAPRLRLRNGYMKWVLRASVAGLVPDEIRLNRGKLGFTFPFRTWAAGRLRGFLREVLRDAAHREYADGDLHLRRFDAYLTRPTWMHEAAIWRIVNLEAWRRLVLERDTLPARWFEA